MNNVTTVTPPRVPDWASRTEVDPNAAEMSWDPTWAVAWHTAAEYENEHADIHVEQQMRADGSPVSAPFVYIDVTTDALTAEQAREIAGALYEAAKVLERG